MYRYGACGAVYWFETVMLPSTNPEVYEALTKRGSWILQRSDGVQFSIVAADQGIEQTINRDMKTAGGL